MDRLSGTIVRGGARHGRDAPDATASTTTVNDAALSERLSGMGDRHPYHPDAPPHHYGVIACAMRHFEPSSGPWYGAFWEVHGGEDPHRVFGLASAALASAVNNLRAADAANGVGGVSSGIDRAGVGGDDGVHPVVAIDIAGAESGYLAGDHRGAYDLAHQSFLNKTVHAGEAYGPESIYAAITDLHAERIGHGSNLFRWDLIGAGEGRGGRSVRSGRRRGDGMSDDRKRAYVENLTRYLGVSISLSSIPARVFVFVSSRYFRLMSVRIRRSLAPNRPCEHASRFA
jgi:adenosine deaminase